MKKIVYLMTISIVLIVTIAGCQSAQGEELLIDFKNDGETFSTGEFHSYVISVEDDSGRPVSVDSIYFYMNMELMNHPMEGTMIESQPGVHEIELPLAMEGEWYVDITVTKGDVVIEERYHVNGEGDMVMDYMKGYNADVSDN